MVRDAVQDTVTGESCETYYFDKMCNIILSGKFLCLAWVISRKECRYSL